MQKVNWVSDGDNHIRLSMPISKVDTEKRLVSGWASVDNIDEHRDLVDAMASKEAFSAFRGNIREMHDATKAAGRLVNFREDMYFDPKTEKFYQGVYVTAYVSKGAQDTWEKVLDGTLSGFSIGGNVLEAESEIDPTTGQPFRRVKKYMLTELSLVDNPANQFANVLSFEKALDSEEVTVTGDLSTITVRSIFVCNKCLDAGAGVHVSSDESVACPACDADMINIGFVESSDPEPNETVTKVIDGYLKDREGGVTNTMEEENTVEVAETEKVVEVEETETPEVQEEETQETTETEEEEAKTEAAEEEEDAIASAVNSLRELTDRIEQSTQAQKSELDTLRKSVDELDERFEKRLESIAANVESLKEEHDTFTKKFEGMEESLGEFKKGLTEVEEATAFKKSADFDQTAEKPKSESIWAGSFLNLESL